MKLFLSILSILCLVQFSSCSSDTVESPTYAVAALKAPPPLSSSHPNKIKAEYHETAADAVGEAYEEDSEVLQSQGPKNNQRLEQKIIKNGRVVFETENLKETRKNVLEQAKKYNAYIANDEEYKSTGRKTNSIILRVPAHQFENLLNSSTTNVQHFDNKEISSEDVTEEFVDLKARITSKKELEKRYFELLKKAKNVKEMLEIEGQLGELRSDIESMQGRLQYIKNRVAYSSLNITFYEEIPENKKVDKKYANGFRSGWDQLMDFIVSLISAWPLIILGSTLFFVARRIFRKRRRKRLAQ
jgi:hypothetical protein